MEDEELDPLRDLDQPDELGAFIAEELRAAKLEVGILDRQTARESKFRLLGDSELEPLLGAFRLT
jgi:hypothetical protein